jgi:hypothetical protein
MTKRVALLMVVVAVLGVVGCAVRKDWFASGGSRADGVAQLSVTWAQFEKPVVAPNQGLALARSKCGAWGYTDAEPFGGQVTKCNSRDYQGNCNGWVATASYQCIGSPSN